MRRIDFNLVILSKIKPPSMIWLVDVDRIITTRTEIIIIPDICKIRSMFVYYCSKSINEKSFKLFINYIDNDQKDQ